MLSRELLGTSFPLSFLTEKLLTKTSFNTFPVCGLYLEIWRDMISGWSALRSLSPCSVFSFLLRASLLQPKRIKKEARERMVFMATVSKYLHLQPMAYSNRKR